MATTTAGRHRRPLYDVIITEHRDMRSRLQALVQASHDGYPPDEVTAVRRALWDAHEAGRRR